MDQLTKLADDAQRPAERLLALARAAPPRRAVDAPRRPPGPAAARHYSN